MPDAAQLPNSNASRRLPRWGSLARLQVWEVWGGHPGLCGLVPFPVPGSCRKLHFQTVRSVMGGSNQIAVADGYRVSREVSNIALSSLAARHLGSACFGVASLLASPQSRAKRADSDRAEDECHRAWGRDGIRRHGGGDQRLGADEEAYRIASLGKHGQEDKLNDPSKLRVRASSRRTVTTRR